MTHVSRVATIGVLAVVAVGTGPTIALAGGGGHCMRDEGQGARVEMEAACFTPSMLYTDAGRRITFVNTDPFAHNVTGSGWGNLEPMNQGDRFSYAFKVDGVYPFTCTLHPGMNGVVVVGAPSSAAAVAADDDVVPQSASARTAGGSDGPWAAAGVVGFVFGAAGGVALDRARRRRAA